MVAISIFIASRRLTRPCLLSRRFTPKDVTLPQCLVVDLYMPFDSGLALIATLRADARFASMRLGVCSGSDAVSRSSARLASGADFYLEKPLDLECSDGFAVAVKREFFRYVFMTQGL
jgi:CheY-like chemotaxis protein